MWKYSTNATSIFFYYYHHHHHHYYHYHYHYYYYYYYCCCCCCCYYLSAALAQCPVSWNVPETWNLKVCLSRFFANLHSVKNSQINRTFERWTQFGIWYQHQIVYTASGDEKTNFCHQWARLVKKTWPPQTNVFL